MMLLIPVKNAEQWRRDRIMLGSQEQDGSDKWLLAKKRWWLYKISTEIANWVWWPSSE